MFKVINSNNEIAITLVQSFTVSDAIHYKYSRSKVKGHTVT